MRRWLLIVLLVAGLLVAAATVPIGGRTMWQRFLGPTPEATAQPSRRNEPKGAVAEAKRNATGKDRSTPGTGVGAADDQRPDLHSDEERKALDDLIERKLKADP